MAIRLNDRLEAGANNNIIALGEQVLYSGTTLASGTTSGVSVKGAISAITENIHDNGGPFDVSKYHNKTYDSINNAISGNTIPSEYRSGGMSIRFINTTTKTYEQWRYIQSGTTNNDFGNVINWQMGSGGDGVFNISTFNRIAATGDPSKYSNLTQAVNGNNVPMNLRSGGMMIKFINNRDKYEQWRYRLNDTSQASFSATTNWEGVDSIPISGSTNLLESGSVYEAYVNQVYIKDDDTTVPGPAEFDPQADCVLISAQTISPSDQKQIRKNLGFGDGDIDTKPTVGSSNVVTSGGVFREINEKLGEVKSESTTSALTLSFELSGIGTTEIDNAITFMKSSAYTHSCINVSTGETYRVESTKAYASNNYKYQVYFTDDENIVKKRYVEWVPSGTIPSEGQFNNDGTYDSGNITIPDGVTKLWVTLFQKYSGFITVTKIENYKIIPLQDQINDIESNIHDNGGPFDVSKYHNETYDSINNVISGDNIPTDYRSGGMSIRFINSNTETYEQWSYIQSGITNDVFSDPTNWQMGSGNSSGFDITKYNQGTTYNTLSDALSGVPETYRDGGMTVRYIQTSDKKYVSFFNTSSGWSTSVSDWQGVDEIPTEGSKNLVTSSGVFRNINEITEKLGEVKSESTTSALTLSFELSGIGTTEIDNTITFMKSSAYTHSCINVSTGETYRVESTKARASNNYIYQVYFTDDENIVKERYVEWVPSDTTPSEGQFNNDGTYDSGNITIPDGVTKLWVNSFAIYSNYITVTKTENYKIIPLQDQINDINGNISTISQGSTSIIIRFTGKGYEEINSEYFSLAKNSVYKISPINFEYTQTNTESKLSLYYMNGEQPIKIEITEYDDENGVIQTGNQDYSKCYLSLYADDNVEVELKIEDTTRLDNESNSINVRVDDLENLYNKHIIIGDKTNLFLTFGNIFTEISGDTSYVIPVSSGDTVIINGNSNSYNLYCLSEQYPYKGLSGVTRQYYTKNIDTAINVNIDGYLWVCDKHGTDYDICQKLILNNQPILENGIQGQIDDLGDNVVKLNNELTKPNIIDLEPLGDKARDSSGRYVFDENTFVAGKTYFMDLISFDSSGFPDSTKYAMRLCFSSGTTTNAFYTLFGAGNDFSGDRIFFKVPDWEGVLVLQGRLSQPGKISIVDNDLNMPLEKISDIAKEYEIEKKPEYVFKIEGVITNNKNFTCRRYYTSYFIQINKDDYVRLSSTRETKYFLLTDVPYTNHIDSGYVLPFMEGYSGNTLNGTVEFTSPDNGYLLINRSTNEVEYESNDLLSHLEINGNVLIPTVQERLNTLESGVILTTDSNLDANSPNPVKNSTLTPLIESNKMKSDSDIFRLESDWWIKEKYLEDTYYVNGREKIALENSDGYYYRVDKKKPVEIQPTSGSPLSTLPNITSGSYTESEISNVSGFTELPDVDGNSKYYYYYDSNKQKYTEFVIKRIKCFIDRITERNNMFKISIISDTHGSGAYTWKDILRTSPYSCYRSIAVFNKIASYCNCAFHGGDISCDYGTSRIRQLQYMYEIIRLFSFNKPFFITKGNHDENNNAYEEADMLNLDWDNVTYYTRDFDIFTRVAAYSIVKTEELTVEQSWILLDGAVNIDSGNYVEADLSELISKLPKNASLPENINTSTTYYFKSSESPIRYTSLFVTKIGTESAWDGSPLYINKSELVADKEFRNTVQHWLSPSNAIWGDGAYYYYDFDSFKLRVITANSFPVDDNREVSEVSKDEEYSWFAQQALNFSDKEDPSKWSVIMLRHTESTSLTDLSSCINAFISGQSWTYKEETVNFNELNGGPMKFIAHIHGHEHENCFSNGSGYFDIGENISAVSLDSLGDALYYGISVLSIDFNNGKVYEDTIDGHTWCYNTNTGRLEIKVGETFLAAKSLLKNPLTINSSDDTKATCSNRNVTAISPGDCNITVTGYEGSVQKTYTYKITVVDNY